MASESPMTGCSAVCLALAVGMLMLLVLSSPSRQLAKDKGQGGQLSYDASWAAGGHQQQQLARPRVAVYTVNMLGKPAPLRTSQDESDIAIGGGFWWAEFLLASRLHNPGLPITALVDRIDAVKANAQVSNALAAAGIELVPIAPFNASTSRAARIAGAAPQLYQRFYDAFLPEAACRNKTVDDRICRPYVDFQASMLGRFCWQADLANQQGVEYVVTMDADVMLTDDLLRTLGDLIPRTDMLTLVEWSSQFVIFRREALDAFCDAMVQHATGMSEAEAREVFAAGNLLLNKAEWTDMLMLAAFLRYMRPDLSRTVLCGTPSMQERPMCPRLAWKLGVGAGFSGMPEDPFDKNCSRLDDYVRWEAAAGEGGSSSSSSSSAGGTGSAGGAAGRRGGGEQAQRALPKAFARWKWTAGRAGGEERAPFIHWMAQCKVPGSQKYIKKYYVEPGLIPDLQQQQQQPAGG